MEQIVNFLTLVGAIETPDSSLWPDEPQRIFLSDYISDKKLIAAIRRLTAYERQGLGYVYDDGTYISRGGIETYITVY